MEHPRSQDHPYHEGERTVQARAGVRAEAQHIADMIQSTLDEHMRAFLSHQPLAVAASADQNGRVWASLLTGEPGFIRAVSEDRIRIVDGVASGDPLTTHRRVGMHLGLLVIDPRDRSRLRINGVVSSLTEGEIELQTNEVYPNCPKYIQRRSLRHIQKTDSDSEIRRSNGLRETYREWIRTADTFFIASTHAERGADASHRGGEPGFIEVSDETLVFPDYPGNNMFCTLGNLTVNPSVGVLLVDFEAGRTLHLTGEADIIWNGQHLEKFDGAERLVEIRVSEAIELPDGNPLRWQLEGYSPHHP